ncbi:MAG: hypothetical protein JNM74_17360 [Myxococcales bacterium]|nr:hypothetical protein [Myxococcales bacterium]
MARPVRSRALVATLVTLFPAAALAEEARDEGEKEAAPASSASSDGSSATAPTAPSPTASARGENEAPAAPRKAPARAPVRAPEPPREQPLLPNVTTAEEYKGIIETVEESVKDRTADLSDVHRLAAMKADYAERAHMRNPILAGTGVFLTVTGVSASILGIALAVAGGSAGSSGSWDFRGFIPIGLAGVAGGIGIAVGGVKLYSYGAASELEPPKQPQPNRVTLRLSPFGAAGTF